MEKLIGFKVDDEMIEAIQKRCKRDRISKSALIRLVLGQELRSELDSIEARNLEALK